MGFSSSSGSIGHPAITPSDLAELRRLASPVFIPRNPADDNTSINAHTSIHPSLQLYLSDLFSATRHHPELDGSLITRQAHQDAEDLIQAYRVISGSSLGTELITTIASTLPDLRLSEEMDSDEGESKVDVDSMGWVRDEGGHRVRMSFEEQVNVAVRVHAPDTPMNGTPYLSTNELQEDGQGSHPRGPPDVWDVSEVDIARIFPRIVSHRLSVRSGPEDEILGSIMFPAVGKHPGLSFSDGDGEGHEEESDGHVRKTVKEILVAILADV